MARLQTLKPRLQTLSTQRAPSPTTQEAGARRTSGLKGVSGIYRITNTANGKFYIGSSSDVRGRIYRHLSHLRSGKHKNAHLLAAFNKYGEGVFAIDLLEEGGQENLLAREQHYLDTLRPGYNILPVAGNSAGYRHSAEAKAAMSKQRMGNKRAEGMRHSDDTRRKLSEIASRRAVDRARLERMRQANVGNKHTAGRPLSEEHRAKVAAASLRMWQEDGRKERRAEQVKARWADPEWKANQLAKIAAGKAAKRAERGLE